MTGMDDRLLYYPVAKHTNLHQQEKLVQYSHVKLKFVFHKINGYEYYNEDFANLYFSW